MPNLMLKFKAVHATILILLKGSIMSLTTELSDVKGRLKALADKSSELRGYL